jgi:hypothetical protein
LARSYVEILFQLYGHSCQVLLLVQKQIGGPHMSYHYEDSSGHSIQILRDIACSRRIQQDFAWIVIFFLFLFLFLFFGGGCYKGDWPRIESSYKRYFYFSSKYKRKIIIMKYQLFLSFLVWSNANFFLYIYSLMWMFELACVYFDWCDANLILALVELRNLAAAFFIALTKSVFIYI